MHTCRWLAFQLVDVALAGLAATPSNAQPGAKPATALENDYVLREPQYRALRHRQRGSVRGPRDSGDGRRDAILGRQEAAIKRGEVAVFGARQSYEIAVGSPFFEVAIKPKHPPIRAPAERIAAGANLALHQGKTFFIYEEILPVGDTRARHSHAQRVEIRLNNGPMLRQQVWQDGKMIETEPVIVNWREPVIHVVHNIGDVPLRNFILEFIPE